MLSQLVVMTRFESRYENATYVLESTLNWAAFVIILNGNYSCWYFHLVPVSSRVFSLDPHLLNSLLVSTSKKP